VAGHTPQEAVNNYIKPLTEALLCITQQRLSRPLSKGLKLNTSYATNLAKMDPVALKGQPQLKFSAGQTFQIVESDKPNPNGRIKISTRSYFYEITTSDDHQILSFHWQPEAKPSKPGDEVIVTPHLHVGAIITSGQTVIRPDEFHKVHVPTGRVSLEQVIWLLIVQFGVAPLKPSWRRTLKQTEDNYERWKSW